MRERDWTEQEFLELDQSQEPRFFEFTDGQIDFPGWPCLLHQSVCGEIGSALHHFMRDQRLGNALMGVCPIQLWAGRWACPDISWHLPERVARLPSRTWPRRDRPRQGGMFPPEAPRPAWPCTMMTGRPDWRRPKPRTSDRHRGQSPFQSPRRQTSAQPRLRVAGRKDALTSRRRCLC